MPEKTPYQAIKPDRAQARNETRLLIEEEKSVAGRQGETQAYCIGAIAATITLAVAGICAFGRFRQAAPTHSVEEPKSAALSEQLKLCYSGIPYLPQSTGTHLAPCIELKPIPQKCMRPVEGIMKQISGVVVDCPSGIAGPDPALAIEFTQQPQAKRATTTSARPSSIRPQVRRKKKTKTRSRYYVQKVAAPVCLGKSVLSQCEAKHAEKNKRVAALAVKIEGAVCFCPPPKSRRKYYEVVAVENETPCFAPDKPVITHKRGLPVSAIHGAPPPRNSTQASMNDVKITKLFDLSCIDARNNMQLADNIRAFGDAMANPASSFVREAMIIHSHATRQGCPTTKALADTEKITASIDRILSSAMTLLPGTKPLDIAQNLIGPILQMVADEMQGRSTELEKQNALLQTVMSMIHQLSHTLAPAEQIPLYSQKINSAQIIAQGKRILTQRFSLRDGKIMIKTGGKDYELHETTDRIPFIIDNDQHYRFVRFNQHSRNWDIINEANNHAYSRENIENIELYKMSPGEWPEKSTLVVDRKGYIGITAPDDPGVWGVFMGESFIPAWWDEHGKYLLTMTNSQSRKTQRVIVSTPYSWEFEPASARMDDNLKLLLETFDTGEQLLPGDRVYPMSPDDDIAADDYDGKSIKKDYKYYKLKSVYNGKKKTYEAELKNYANAKVRHEHSMFKLESADEMIFPFSIAHSYNVLQQEKSFAYEKDLVDYLLRHGKTASGFPERSINDLPGLYLDKERHEIFIIDDQKFAVSQYMDRELHLVRHTDIRSDIVLINDDGVYIRKRDEEQRDAENYKELSKCRGRRDNDGQICLFAVVEPELDQLLLRYINEQRCLDITSVPQNLVVSDKFNVPYVYRDEKTTKYYFKYAMKYFDAEFIEPHDKRNPTWLPAIKIYVKGSFLRRLKTAKTVVIESFGNRLEIKCVETFVSEKFNVNKAIASNYIKKKYYRDEQNINIIDELINQAKVSGLSLIIQDNVRPSWLGSRISLTTQKSIARDVLFPPRIKEDKDLQIKFIKLDDPANTPDSYEQEALKIVKEKLQYVKGEVLLTAIDSLRYDAMFWSEFNAYIGEILQSNSAGFSADFAIALRKRLQYMQESIKADHVYLLTAINKQQGVAHTESLLTPMEMTSGRVVYMAHDADGKIFINIDKVISDANLHNMPATDLVSEIIRSAAESAIVAVDFDEPGKINGMYIPVMDAVDDLIDKIESQRLSPPQMNNLIDLTKKYLYAHPVYNKKATDFISPRKIAYLAQHDPGFRAHLLNKSADFVTILALDIFFSRSVNELPPARVEGWMKRYGEVRSVSRIGMDNPPISTGEIDTAILAQKIVRSEDLREVVDNPNIFYTVPDLELLIKTEQGYFPVEFVGKSGQIVFIGAQRESRQAYYYNPRRGNIKPIQQQSSYAHTLIYNRDLDLYEQKNTVTGESSVLIFDQQTEKLIDTGSSKIVIMAGGGGRLVFPHYDLFYPKDAPPKVYLAAHAERKLGLNVKKRLPANVDVHFYTETWRPLDGHVDDLNKLVHDEYSVTQTVKGGEVMEFYRVILDQDSHINYHDLAQESKRCLVRIHIKDEIDTNQLAQAVSRLFMPKTVDLHLYICRSIK